MVVGSEALDRCSGNLRQIKNVVKNSKTGANNPFHLFTWLPYSAVYHVQKIALSLLVTDYI